MPYYNRTDGSRHSHSGGSHGWSDYDNESTVGLLPPSHAGRQTTILPTEYWPYVHQVKQLVKQMNDAETSWMTEHQLLDGLTELQKITFLTDLQKVTFLRSLMQVSWGLSAQGLIEESPEQEAVASDYVNFGKDRSRFWGCTTADGLAATIASFWALVGDVSLINSQTPRMDMPPRSFLPPRRHFRRPTEITRGDTENAWAALKRVENSARDRDLSVVKIVANAVDYNIVCEYAASASITQDLLSRQDNNQAAEELATGFATGEILTADLGWRTDCVFHALRSEYIGPSN